LALVVFANDGIALPVTDAASLLYDGGSLADAHTPIERAAPLLTTAITLAFFLLAAQKADQINALRFK
jgi:hypothetical protein